MTADKEHTIIHCEICPSLGDNTNGHSSQKHRRGNGTRTGTFKQQKHSWKTGIVLSDLMPQHKKASILADVLSTQGQVEMQVLGLLGKFLTRPWTPFPNFQSSPLYVVPKKELIHSAPVMTSLTRWVLPPMKYPQGVFNGHI